MPEQRLALGFPPSRGAPPFQGDLWLDKLLLVFQGSAGQTITSFGPDSPPPTGPVSVLQGDLQGVGGDTEH